MRLALLTAVLVGLIATPAQAQDRLGVLFNGLPPSSASTYSKAEADAAIAAAIQALDTRIPVPADSIPPTEMIGGTAGSAPTFRRGDAANPRITRAATVTTDTSGNWAVTWATALPSAPVVLPIPVNAGAQPIVCNVATRTMTGASGRCWLARSLPAAIVTLTSLLSYDVFGAAASSISVQVLAIPVTQ